MIGLFDQMNRSLRSWEKLKEISQILSQGEAGRAGFESKGKSLESFPSHINPSVYFVEWSNTVCGFYLWSSTSHLWSPAGHNQSNSNLLTSINRAITFYGRNPLIFSPAAAAQLKKVVKKQRGSADAISTLFTKDYLL